MSLPRVTLLYNIPIVGEGSGAIDRLSPDDPSGDVHAIQMALRSLGYGVEILPVAASVPTLIHNLALRPPELIFNLVEAIAGESSKEPCLAAALDLLGIPYTGSDPVTLALALRKSRTKEILRARGIRTPRGSVVPPGAAWSGEPGPPVIVKPDAEDASLGLWPDSVTARAEPVPALVARIHSEFRCAALVEEFVDGREFNVAFLGSASSAAPLDRAADAEGPRALPISEIEFTGKGPRFVSYEAKWTPGSEEYRNTTPRCPANLNPEIAERVVAVARSAYEALEVRDYGRVDLRMNSAGEVFVLEVNPNPDLSPDAGLVRSARAAGLDYTGLVREILRSALARVPVRA
jgi:D-alanine-D-alanine ligase